MVIFFFIVVMCVSIPFQVTLLHFITECVSLIAPLLYKRHKRHFATVLRCFFLSCRKKSAEFESFAYSLEAIKGICGAMPLSKPTVRTNSFQAMSNSSKKLRPSGVSA